MLELKRLLKETNSDEIAFLIGDFIDLETAYLSKKLSDSLNIKSIECRQEGCKIPFNHRSQYSFNSKVISGLQDIKETKKCFNCKIEDGYESK